MRYRPFRVGDVVRAFSNVWIITQIDPYDGQTPNVHVKMKSDVLPFAEGVFFASDLDLIAGVEQ